MVKELEGGEMAVGIFNPGNSSLSVAASFDQLGLKGPQRARDLWRQQNLGVLQNRVQFELPPHGVRLLRMSSRRSA